MRPAREADTQVFLRHPPNMHECVRRTCYGPTTRHTHPGSYIIYWICILCNVIIADTINHWAIQPCRTISDRGTWLHRGVNFASPRLKMHCIRAQNIRQPDAYTTHQCTYVGIKTRGETAIQNFLFKKRNEIVSKVSAVN